MTKFRVKKPIELPKEKDDQANNLGVHFDEGSAKDHSASGLSVLQDDALIGSMGENMQCQCKATVLVVDDNEFNLLPLTIMLKANHKIICVKALNGAEAVRIFKKDRAKRCCKNYIQLILMDLVMPILDGFDATTQIMDILKQERAIAGTYDTSNDTKKPAEMAAEMGVSIAAITAYID